MATRLHLNQLAMGKEFDVAEDFDEVMNKCYPSIQITDNVQAREACTFHDAQTGSRVFIQNLNLIAVEELE